MKKLSVWDIIAWIVLLALLVWIILKVAGIIQTPNLLEYVPYFGIVYLAGWAMHKLEAVESNVRDLKNFSKATVKEINEIKLKCIKNHPS